MSDEINDHGETDNEIFTLTREEKKELDDLIGKKCDELKEKQYPLLQALMQKIDGEYEKGFFNVAGITFLSGACLLDVKEEDISRLTHNFAIMLAIACKVEELNERQSEILKVADQLKNVYMLDLMIEGKNA